MTLPDDLLPSPLTASAVRSYVNFDGGTTIDLDGSAQAQLQSQGVSAVWQLLNTKGYAYLADEVGMGKTRQAMGIIATQFLSDPKSHVVIVCPGKTLQAQWSREWDTFIRTCYKALDNRLVSIVDGKPLHTPQLHERLSDFAKALLLNEGRIHLLRYSSFSRPIWFAPNPGDTPASVMTQYVTSLHEIGISEADSDEFKLVNQTVNGDKDWRETLTARLNEAYARRIGTLLKNRCIDLVTLDEAQYLRHVDNRQNTNLAHVFRGNVPKWLFLSATPLHSGPADIKSLDTYLCKQPQGHNKSKACSICTFSDACTQAAHRMRENSPDRLDVVTLLAEFMVRRPRSFKDGNSQPRLHDKVGYRRYRRVAASASADPFLALTMAAVQRQLVVALNGQSNRFRQGECSSFESLAASVNRMRNDRDGNPQVVPEIDKQEHVGKKPPEKTPDRDIIDRLNRSFFETMFPGVNRGETPDPKYNLPHAKLTQVCDTLKKRNLCCGSLHKTLVFVRRLDTVNEMVLLLMSRFQSEVDERIDVWHDFLAQPPPGITLREAVWHQGGFWGSRVQDDDTTPENEVELNEDEAADQDLSRRATSLAYFEAIKRKSGKQSEHGMLVSFQSRLLTAPPKQVPFAGFLLHPPEAFSGAEEAKLWDAAQRHWEQLLGLLIGETRDTATLPYAWLFEQTLIGEAAWKLATLKRCLLQSLRQSDFLVDLYILNRFVSDTPDLQVDTSLASKLLWLLTQAEGDLLPKPLLDFLGNWKVRMRRWLDHFDLIVDKCLRKDGARNWEDIYQKVDATFARMSPVLGRSGMLANKNAVDQFNFPTHPNILVCTDVLKEGVDMHLFCDEIIHYGVAWTSGDLEQRIGRIDRFGSQISRRIGAYTESELAGMPRLNVEFPFLEGTLDRYQVERVMLAKIKSDLRMDLGKQENEIGQITLGQLDNPDEEGRTTQQAMDHYPASTREVISGEIESKGKFATTKYLGTADPACTHAPELGAMIVRRPWTGERNYLLRTFAQVIRGKKTDICQQEEYLVALGQDTVAPTLGLGEALQQSSPFAVSVLPFAGNFHFDKAWNTLVRQISISNPFHSGRDRIQTVLLERSQDYLLLRTPIARLDQQTEVSDWMAIITNESKRRRWGYLVKDEQTVWFVCFLLMPVDSLHGDILETLTVRVAKVGDRLQQLYSKGGNSEVWRYRARTSIGDTAARHSAYFSEREINFMSTDTDDLQAHGRLLAGSHQWLLDAFTTVLNTLYDKNTDDRGLEIQPISLLENGVLHIHATGKERFKIEAYLQLAPESDANGTPPPRMIWQVAASTSTTGPRPDLKLYDWGELPHVNLEGWNSQFQENHRAVYDFQIDNRRYFVLCHAPAKWDSARNKMISAWAALLDKMTGQNFLRKYASDAFFSALADS